MFLGFRLTHSSDSFVRPNKDRDRATETADHVFVRERERESERDSRPQSRHIESARLTSAQLSWLAGGLAALGFPGAISFLF